ncbi:MAG: hypothetical protein IKT03_08195, partial [Muribaculaceae bacterium]|nr:hypothetical protein [Muribaculaceae bacterium]
AAELGTMKVNDEIAALEIMSMINQYKKVPDNNYCERVTANDGEKGERDLKLFQNNDLLRPTILTTSQKLSTGVDARNVRNIVLFRPVNNMVEFKQIMGRGTRLFDGKYFFTLYDYVGASKNFQDEEWDGDPFCPICGNYPCTCGKIEKPDDDTSTFEESEVTYIHATPCPVCGHLPCTCEGNGGGRKNKVVVKLSPLRSLSLKTEWTERVQFGDELITIEEYVKRLFGKLPEFLDGEEDLRERWANPDTRQQLLDLLERSGFQEDKLNLMRRFMELENCDMLDVLSYLAYNTTPIDRKRRADILREDMNKKLSNEQQFFANFILNMYVRNDFKELSMDKLSTLIEMKYHTINDAKNRLNMDVMQMRDFFIDLQHELYNGAGLRSHATA